jgi:dTDP-4-amino-4,6-dideoxygalactose transaminase
VDKGVAALSLFLRQGQVAAAAGVPCDCGPLWKPMRRQPVFAGGEVVGGGVAEALFRAGLCLPSGTALAATDLARVTEIIRRGGRGQSVAQIQPET